MDVLGAEQAGAQALVHFGPACLSPPARPLPVAFVFGQRPVALELCAQALEAQNPDPTAPVVLLSEPACAHALGEGFRLRMQGEWVSCFVHALHFSTPQRVLNMGLTPAFAFGSRLSRLGNRGALALPGPNPDTTSLFQRPWPLSFAHGTWTCLSPAQLFPCQWAPSIQSLNPCSDLGVASPWPQEGVWKSIMLSMWEALGPALTQTSIRT